MVLIHHGQSAAARGRFSSSPTLDRLLPIRFVAVDRLEGVAFWAEEVVDGHVPLANRELLHDQICIPAFGATVCHGCSALASAGCRLRNAPFRNCRVVAQEAVEESAASAHQLDQPGAISNTFIATRYLIR